MEIETSTSVDLTWVFVALAIIAGMVITGVAVVLLRAHCCPGNKYSRELQDPSITSKTATA
jgi:hypothetical protein